MKKLFFAICAVLPGGFLLIGVIILFIGCAWTQNGKIYGLAPVNPSEHVIAQAIGEDISADAHLKRKCADSPMNCRALELTIFGQWGLYGGNQWSMPGGTWGTGNFPAIQQPSGTSENLQNKQDVVKKEKAELDARMINDSLKNLHLEICKINKMWLKKKKQR
ncbi:MAG: hypothetical protein V1661_01700 [bacterium]